jgi:hypothetical protein
MTLPLSVLADLDLSIDGEDFTLYGDGERLVMNAPRLRSLRRLLTTGPLAMSNAEQNAERFAEALELAGLTLEVRVQGDTVARIGKDATPNALGQLLNVGPVEARPAQTLRSVARRHPVATGLGGAALLALLAFLLRRPGSGD